MVILYCIQNSSRQKVAGSNWDEDNQLEQLKFKVDSHTKRIISRCKTMSEVWLALDNEYAQEEEIVNAVNSQLKQLKSAECSTSEYIVNLRNHIPVLESALETVNGLEHLQTPDKVNFLVGKFDSLMQRDWEYYKRKHSGKTWDRFFAFILDRYDACRSTIARLKSQDTGTDSTSQNDAGSFKSNATSAGCVKCKKWIAKGGAYLCPACGHQVSEGNSIGHCLQHCESYIAMTANQRSDCIENAQFCPLHLSGTHNFENCLHKSDPRNVCGMNGCTKHHHRSLHGSTTPFIANINSLYSEGPKSDVMNSNAPVLLSMQNIPTVSGNIISFFDDGSDCSLILNSAAKRLGLKGEAVVMEITTVTGVVKTDSHVYIVTILDREGNSHNVKAFGLDKLNGKIEKVDVDGVKTLFSQTTQQEWDKIAMRPTGEVELLIGSDNLGLHPTEFEAQGNLKVYKSNFGSGYVIVGKHPALKCQHSEGNVSFVHVSLHATKLSFKSIREYFDANELHVEAPRRCNNCLNCNDCSFQGQQMSLREQYEYEVMCKNVTFDESNHVFRVKYPFLEDPSILTNNFSQVAKIAAHEEKKLILMKD